MKRILFSLSLMLCMLSSMAQNKTWKEPPAINHPQMAEMFKVKEVIFTDEETLMRLHVKYPAGQWIRFATDSHLRADNGKTYKITGGKATKSEENDITVDSLFWMPDSGEADIALHFNPLPAVTMSFDFIEGYEKGAFRIWSITNPESEPVNNLFNSSWRNELTGEWEIGFYKDCAIYDCQMWQYEARKDKRVVLTNGHDRLTVNIGKEKNGRRKITVNGKKQLCSRITTKHLPDYPSADNTPFNTELTEGYATITGWLKDWPEEILNPRKDFDVVLNSVFTDSREEYNTKIDSLGHFTIKVPLTGVQEAFLDWRRAHIATILAPGETYFLLVDMKAGQALFMGKDARVQNERLSHDITDMGYVPIGDRQSTLKDEELIEHKNKYCGIYKKSIAKLEEEIREHPSLSRRFRDYSRENIKYYVCMSILETQFYAQEWTLPEEILKYIGETASADPTVPVTLSQYQSLYLNYILMYYRRKNVDKIKASVADGTFMPFKTEAATIDSLFTDQTLREVCRARELYLLIDIGHTPLEAPYLAAADSIKLPAARNAVINAHNYYRDILEKSAEAVEASIHPAADVEGLTDGKAILDKIAEPYKGRIIYMDIWGTWCSPCKKKLKESYKVKEALKDYDIVYLYLVNRSPEESWKNVIAEYNLTGPNCVHYRLPEDQQRAIEQYVRLTGYPTYRLIDKQGNIHDLHWLHTDDMEQFINKIKNLDSK